MNDLGYRINNNESPCELRWGLYTITPEYSEVIIKYQKENYPCYVNSEPTHELVMAMKNSTWRMNGDPIIFSNGKLSHGAELFTACIKSNKEFRTLIVEQMGDDVLVTLGAHRKRTFSDILKIATPSLYPGALASTINNIYAMQKQAWTTTQRISAPRGLGVAMSARYPGIDDCVKKAFSKSHDMRLVPPAIYATALFMLGRVDAKAAADFVDWGLCKSQQDIESLPTPIGLVRKILDGENKKTSKLFPREVMALIVRAWNAWRGPDNGKSMKKIQWSSTGSKKQAFPSIRGWEPKHDLDISYEAIADNNDNYDEDIEVSLETITPRHAKIMLNEMVRNRNIVSSYVDELARDMSAGNWAVNGTTIKFDTNGKLCDGQHRLTACVKSGKEIKSLVVRGVDPAAFNTFDVSTTRSFDKYLKSKGQKYGTTIAAGIKLLINIEKRNMRNSYSPTNTEMQEYYNNNKYELSKLVHTLHKLEKLCTPCVAFVSTVLLHKADKSRSEIFLSMLSNGYDIPHGCPIMNVRDTLVRKRPSRNKDNENIGSKNISHGNGKRNYGPQAYMYESVALVINGWNAWLSGGKVSPSSRSLVWKAENGLPFPIPVTIQDAKSRKQEAQLKISRTAT